MTLTSSDASPFDGADMLPTLLAVVEQSPVGVLLLDPAGVVVFENAHVRETAADAWVGRDATRLEALSARARSALRALVRHRRPFRDIEATVERPGGERRVVVLSGAPVRGAEGEAVLIATLSDVTERLEGEAARALQHRVDAAEAALRQAALGRPDALALLETAVARVAEALGATVGAAFLEAESPPTALVRCAAFPPGEAPDVIDLDVSAWPAVRAGQAVAVAAGEAPALLAGLGARHALLLPVDGAAPGVLVLGRRVPFSEAERFAGARLAALFSTLWAWTDAEARFQRTVADLDDALFTFAHLADGRRAYAFVTPQVEALTGLDPDAVLAGDADWAALVHDDDREAFRRHDARLRVGEASTVDVRVACGAHGAAVWLRERATPSLDAAGRSVAGGLLSDVTAQKEAEATLDRARRVAERAADARMAFLRLMSHELRTPLGAIRGFADLLADEVALLSDAPPEIAEFTGTIGEAAARALHLVSNLLDLAHLETDSLGLTLRPVDVASLAQASVARIAPDLAARGVALRVDADSPALALADAVRLEQVLAQLVGNAATFTTAGEVRVGVAVGPAEIQVSVADTGAGMDETFLEALFEPFAQEDTRVNRDREGTGLGLAIARRLAEAMGGRLEARSVKGEGSTFTLALPLAPAGGRQ